MIIRILLTLLLSFSAVQAQPTVGPIDHREIGTAVPAMNDSRISGAAQRSSNLSDLASIPAARATLGVVPAISTGGALEAISGILWCSATQKRS